MVKLTAVQLRQLILKEAKNVIAEKQHKLTNEGPKSFSEFCDEISFQMKSAGAPSELVKEVREGREGGASNVLMNAWTTIQRQRTGNYGTGVNPKDVLKEGFWNYFSYEIEDAVAAAINEFYNPINYSADRRVKKVNVGLLSEGVMSRISKRHSLKEALIKPGTELKGGGITYRVLKRSGSGWEVVSPQGHHVMLSDDDVKKFKVLDSNSEEAAPETMRDVSKSPSDFS